MSDKDSSLQSARRGVQTRLSPVWIVPIVALLIGVWLVYDNIRSLGPQITLEIADAEGIEAGATLIRLLNVEVGRVEQVRLSEDLSHALITARMTPEAEDMLAEDTRFWVVKPRIGIGGISGLSTVFSGVYIQLQPGQSENDARRFEVLGQPPVSANGAEGVHLRLTSELGNSLQVGDPVNYQGFVVGRVEEVEFDAASRRMRHRLFVESPYDVLVTENARFWNASGVDLNLDSQGFRVSVESLESVLVGGVTFGYLKDVAEGGRVADETGFVLYDDQESAMQDSFQQALEYVLLVDGTVRGLSAGAPVEYRGVRVGTVVSAPWNFTAPQAGAVQDYSIPVLIRIEPQRIEGSGGEMLSLDEWGTRLDELFREGLRATLRAGNLLTGAMFVDLNFEENPEAAYVASRFEDRPVFPTTPGGFAQIEAQITALLDKLNKLEVEPVLASLDETLRNSQTMMQEVEEVAAAFEAILADPETRALPASLNRSLREMQATLDGFSPDSSGYREMTQAMDSLERLLRDLQPVARTLGEKPNALIFDRREAEDPVPRAP